MSQSENKEALYAGAAPAAQPELPQKARPDFIAGYDAGMADAKRMAQQGEPSGLTPRGYFIKGWDARGIREGLKGSIVSDGDMRDYMRDIPGSPAPQAQQGEPETWTDDGGWTFPVERQIIQTR